MNPATEQTRRTSARDKVLARLEAGPTTNLELNDLCFRYGARIHELRRQGYDIRGEAVGDGVFIYTLAQPTAPEPRVRLEALPAINIPAPPGRLF